MVLKQCNSLDAVTGAAGRIIIALTVGQRWTRSKEEVFWHENG